MVYKVHRKIIASVAALSILVTAVGTGSASAQNHAAPSQSRNYAAEQAIAAILGLAVIGVIASKKKKDKERAHASTRSHPPAPKPQAQVQKPHHQKHAHHLAPKPLPPRAYRSRLPEHCLRVFPTDRGHARIFGQRCMSRHYQATQQLPNRCYREVWTQRGYRGGWGARCLRNHGYQVARH